jgi:hypothetical protein
MGLLQEHWKQLEAAPVTELVGIVSPRGVGGAQSRGDEFWTLQFDFSGWMEPGGIVQTSELRIQKQVPDEEIAQFRKKLSEYDVVRVRVRLCRDNVLGSPQALLIDFLGKDDSDGELCAYAKALQEPVTFEDSQFGVFTLDRRVNWYAASPEWGNSQV